MERKDLPVLRSFCDNLVKSFQETQELVIENNNAGGCEDEMYSNIQNLDLRPQLTIFSKNLLQSFKETAEMDIVNNSAGRCKAAIFNSIQNFDSDLETKKTAVHEAGHVVCTWYWGIQSTVTSVTTIPNGMIAGYTVIRQNHTFSAMEEDFERIGYLLSGLIAEYMFLGIESIKFQFTYSKGSDLYGAFFTSLYMALETLEAGDDKSMNDHIFEKSIFYLKKGLKAAFYVLKTNEKSLIKVALNLLEKSTLTKEDLQHLLGPPRSRSFKLYDRYCGFTMNLRTRNT